MTLKKQNPWKLLSIGLLGIIAIGLLTPVDAKPPSGEEESQLEALFDLINEVLGVVEGIDTDLGDIAGNVTDIKTQTDKIPMIKTDLATIQTDILEINATTNAIEDETDKIPMIKTDVGSIKTDVSSIKTDVTNLVSSSSQVFRIAHHFEDGADNEYDGDIIIDRISGSGVFQIEKLYLCDLDMGGDTGDDRLWIYYGVEGSALGNPDGIAGDFLNDFKSGPFTNNNPGCVDIQYANRLNAQIGLAGDGSNNVRITLEEMDVDTTMEDDPNGAELVAYISGLSEASDIEITSDTDDT